MGAVSSSLPASETVSCNFSGGLVGHQFPMHYPLSDHPCNNRLHLVYCVALADAVAPGELIDVALQMLVAHLVIDAIVRPFEHRPEAFNPVGMGPPPL